MFLRSLLAAVALVSALSLPVTDAHAVTLAEAVAAEELIKAVDKTPPEQRAAFIRTNRAQLNQALLIHQIIGAIAHTVEVTSQVSEKAYHRILLCGTGRDDDDDNEKDKNHTPAKAPGEFPDVLYMVADFRADLKIALKLPDTPETEARLDKVDVTDAIVNGMFDLQGCAE